MNEKIMIEFTPKEFDNIMGYMDEVKAETVQDAIMDAIEKALPKIVIN